MSVCLWSNFKNIRMLTYCIILASVAGRWKWPSTVCFIFTNPVCNLQLNENNNMSVGSFHHSTLSNNLFLFVQWMLLITIVRYREHDQYGGSMIKVYRTLSQCSNLEFLSLISMIPNRGWKNKIVWFLIARWLLACIIVFQYEEHDQDGGSMIMVYRPTNETK